MRRVAYFVATVVCNDDCEYINCDPGFLDFYQLRLAKTANLRPPDLEDDPGFPDFYQL